MPGAPPEEGDDGSGGGGEDQLLHKYPHYPVGEIRRKELVKLTSRKITLSSGGVGSTTQ